MAEIEVTVQSILSSDEPQGRFRLRISLDATADTLLKQLCREANAPLKPEYCLRNKSQVLDRGSTLSECGVEDGVTLLWTSECLTTKTGCCNMFLFLAVISFIIGVCGIIAICVIEFKEDTGSIGYAVVFDAGSTHTSMFVYKWDASKLNGTAVATQAGKKCTAKGDGIASFASDPTLAGISLKPCLKKAQNIIPEDRHSEAAVYLGATAGMRLLNESNPVATEKLLKSVRDTFQQSVFLLTDPQQSVRIISGTDEGSFSWITSNYVTNSFNVERPGVEEIEARTIWPTIGALDLGGASTQISFIPENSSSLPDGFKKELQLFGYNYTVYTHSYLCYGVREMANRMYAALVQGRNETDIEFPCLPEGYNITKTYKEIYASPCVSGNAGSSSFGHRFLPDKNIDQEKNYTFVGMSQPKECAKLTNTTLFNFTECTYPSCSFNGIYQPEVYGPFYAFSTFYYVSSFLNLTNASTTYFSHGDFVAALNNICNMTWAELQEIPASGPNKENLPVYCLQTTYINLLLRDGYKFSNNTWRDIHFVEKVSSTEVGWTLGFVLNESLHYLTYYPGVTMYILTFTLLMVLFCLFIIVAVGLAIQARRVRVARNDAYKQLDSYGAI